MSNLHHGEQEAESPLLGGLRWAVILSLLILGIESIGAYFSHSLSLTVDAVHNVPDILAFAVSWTALLGTREGASPEYTFGTHRKEIFAGIFNGAIVLATGLAFGVEALLSLVSGRPFAGAVDPVWLLLAAVPTLALRMVNLRLLGKMPGRIRDLNVSSVMVHMASDVAITATLLVAGAALLFFPSLFETDAVGALVIAAILVYESWPLLREGWEVLTERTPRGMSTDSLTKAALEVPGVLEIHDIHVWAVCSTLVCMTAHVEVRDMPLPDAMSVIQRLRERMSKEFGIAHSTFEMECHLPRRSPPDALSR